VRNWRSSRARGALAVEGDRQALRGEPREGLRQGPHGAQPVGAGRQFLHVHEGLLQHREHESVQGRVGVLLPDRADQILRAPGAEGIQFQEPVPALLQPVGQSLPGGVGPLEEAGSRTSHEAVPERFQELAPAMEGYPMASSSRIFAGRERFGMRALKIHPSRHGPSARKARMKKRTTWLVSILAGLVLLGLGAVVMAMKGKEEVTYTVATAARQDLREIIGANGEIQALTRVQVGAQVTATIKTIHVKDGEIVRAGDLLVTLDQEHYRQALNQTVMGQRMARKDLEAAETTYRKQDQTCERQRALLEGGYVSNEDFQQTKLVRDTAATALDRARVAVQQADALVAMAQDDLSKTEIRASMPGRVTGLKAEKGEMAIAGTTNLAGAVLMIISDLSEMLAEVRVGELDVAKLKPDQAAEIQVDALPGKVLQGRVLDVATSIDRTTAQPAGTTSQDPQNYRVRVRILGAGAELAGLHPGMSAHVAVLVNEAHNVLTVPLQAIQERESRGGGLGLIPGTRTVVFVAREGRASERVIRTGTGTRLAVQVLEGVADGERVITGPVKVMSALAEGAAVKVQSEQDALKGRRP